MAYATSRSWNQRRKKGVKEDQYAKKHPLQNEFGKLSTYERALAREKLLAASKEALKRRNTMNSIKGERLNPSIHKLDWLYRVRPDAQKLDEQKARLGNLTIYRAASHEREMDIPPFFRDWVLTPPADYAVENGERSMAKLFNDKMRYIGSYSSSSLSKDTGIHEEPYWTPEGDTPIEKVAAIFGGLATLSLAMEMVGVDLDRKTMYKWRKTPTKVAKKIEGTALGWYGLIPVEYFPKIFEAARLFGVVVRINDVLPEGMVSLLIRTYRKEV